MPRFCQAAVKPLKPGKMRLTGRQTFYICATTPTTTNKLC